MSRFNEEDFEEDFYDSGEDFLEDLGSSLGGLPVDIINKWKDQEHEINGQEINVLLLRHAMMICKEGWFWRFRSINTRLKMLIETYYILLDMIKED